MRVALATIVRGRTRHLERQVSAVARLDPAPERHVIVSLDIDAPAIDGRIVHHPVPDGEPLPLAAARNIAIANAGDVDLVVCLDADCIPDAALTRRLSLLAPDVVEGALLSGAVGRLGPLPAAVERPSSRHLEEALGRAARGGRPVLPEGDLAVEPRVERFWSLAFAVAPEVHARIGGFDAGYIGYGAEDTDYAFRARAAGVPLVWIGGPWAYHQDHPVSSPPVEHLEDIVRNARHFHAVWGRWPMEGWLAEFQRRGLVTWEAAGDQLDILDRSTKGREPLHR